MKNTQEKIAFFEKMKSKLEPGISEVMAERVKSIDDCLVLTFMLLLFYGGKYADVSVLDGLEVNG